MKTTLLILAGVALIYLKPHAQCDFNKVYNTCPSCFNGGTASIQAFDGGFIAVGNSDITSTTDGTYILKVNACGDTLWQKIYELSSGTGGDLGYSVIQLLDSTYVICGSMYNNTEGASDAFLLKLDKNGDSLWMKQINAGYNDWGKMHKQTRDHGFVVGGYFNVTNGKVFLVKTDSNGNIEWEKQYGADTLENFLFSVDTTYDGGFVLGGYFRNSTTLKRHLFLIRTDSNGDTLWVKKYGDPACNEYKGYVVSTLDKGFVQAGYRRNPDNTAVRYIIKTDSTGTVEWEKTFGFPVNNDVFIVVRQLPDSSFIASGSTHDTRFGSSSPRILLMKLSPQGDSLWAKLYTYYGSYQFNNIADDYVNDLTLTSDGGFIMCGYIINNYMPGQNDLLLIKTDSLGNTCTIDTTTWAGCFNFDCSFMNAAFNVSADTIDLKYTDTVYFYAQSPYAGQWQWDFGDGTTDTVPNPAHAYDTTGTFPVRLIISFGNCIDTVYTNIFVKNTTGIQGQNLASSYFRVYPNPASDNITLEYNLRDCSESKVGIYDILGYKVLESKLIENEIKMDISTKALNSGVYHLVVKCNGEALYKTQIVIIK